MLDQMQFDTLTNNFTESDRHSIANHSANRFETVLAIRFYEFVSLWERLKDCALAQGNGAVLFGVAEAAIAAPSCIVAVFPET